MSCLRQSRTSYLYTLPKCSALFDQTRHFFVLWSISWPYLCRILAVSLPYVGCIFAVSLSYLGHIMALSWPYFGEFLCRILTYLGRNLAVSLSHIGRILTVNWLYLGRNLEVFWPYYWPYFEEYLDRILDSILAVFWCLFRHIFVALAFQCPLHLSSLLYSLDYHAMCCDKITIPLSNIESRRWKSGEPVTLSKYCFVKKIKLTNPIFTDADLNCQK